MTYAVLVVVVLLQGLSGAIVWSWLSRRRDPIELLGMGLALGTIGALLSGLALQAAGVPPWGWPLPSLVIVGVWIVLRVRRREHPRLDPVDRPTTVALIVGALLGAIFIGVNLRLYPLAWTGSWSGYHTDMPFFEALAGSIAQLGPFDSVFHPGAQIRYHWLSYGWAGQLTATAGAEPFVVLTRVLPVVAVVAAVAQVTAWARRLSSVGWVPTLAVALLMSGGFLGAIYGGVLNFDSPSQSMGIVWLLAYAVVLADLLAPSLSARRSVAVVGLLGVLAACLTGGKVSAAAPALAGVLLVALVGLVRRETWGRRAALGAGVSVVAAAAAYLVILSGAAGSGGLGMFDLVDRASSQQGLNPTDGMRGVILGTAILMVAMAARWAGLGWLVLDPDRRWQPMTIFGVGLAGTGLAALAVFNGFNEIWFGLAASAPLAVLSAQGAGEAAEYLGRSRGNRRAVVVACLVAAAVVFVVVWALWATGASGGNVFVGTARWTGPLVGVGLAILLGGGIAIWVAGTRRVAATVAAAVVILVLVTAPARLLGVGTGQVGMQQAGLRSEWFSVSTGLVRGEDVKVVTEWTEGLMAAAAWLRSNADPDDVLATNLTFGPFVPGVTGLRTYVSAIQYQGPYGRSSEIPDLLMREAQVWDFLENPSTSTAAPLCAGDVSWLWVDPALTTVREWAPFAVPVFANDDVIILRLDEDAC